MSNKLDDRYVEYDLANSINILPVENGGTGIQDLQNADRILVSVATGIPGSPLRVGSSGWDIEQLNSLSSWDRLKGPFEARIQTTETHLTNTAKHIPTGGTNTTFLRGDNTWQSISADASSVYCIDQFHYSNNTNVQAVLNDIDQALYDRIAAGGTSSTFLRGDNTWHEILPSGGNNTNFLRGDNTWQVLSNSASSIVCVDQFHYSNALNVQAVLNDIDQALYDKAYTASQITAVDTFVNSNSTNVQNVLQDFDAKISANVMVPGTSIGSTYMVSSGRLGTNDYSWNTTLPTGTWKCAVTSSFHASDDSGNGTPGAGIGTLKFNGTTIGMSAPTSDTQTVALGIGQGSGTITLSVTPSTQTSIHYPQFMIVATRIS